MSTMIDMHIAVTHIADLTLNILVTNKTGRLLEKPIIEGLVIWSAAVLFITYSSQSSPQTHYSMLGKLEH